MGWNRPIADMAWCHTSLQLVFFRQAGLRCVVLFHRKEPLRLENWQDIEAIYTQLMRPMFVRLAQVDWLQRFL